MPAVASPSTNKASATPTTRPSTEQASSPTQPKLGGGRSAPTMKEAAEEGKYIRRGQRGESVQRLQEMLAQRGYDVGESDGRMGAQTTAAVRAFQRDQGISVDGVVGPQTLGKMGVPGLSPSSASDRRGTQRRLGRDSSLRAPRFDERSPTNGRRAGDLASGAASARLRRVSTPVTSSTADGRLAQIQQASVNSASRELDAGVREDRSLGSNRGERIDEYARTSGMSRGGEWCGYFTGFNYTQAASESGTKFSGQKRLHSYQKARSYFLYRNYTNASRPEVAKNEALRTSQGAEGSQRRYMTFEGSVGDRYASRRDLPHETFSKAADLPIRAGDTALFARGHVGMVESYDAANGRLTTIEGNVGNRVQRKTYDLNDPAVRAAFDGFGRPAAGDFAPVN